MTALKELVSAYVIIELQEVLTTEPAREWYPLNKGSPRGNFQNMRARFKTYASPPFTEHRGFGKRG